MKHLNTYDDHVTIIDYELRRIVSVFIGGEGLLW